MESGPLGQLLKSFLVLQAGEKGFGDRQIIARIALNFAMQIFDADHLANRNDDPVAAEAGPFRHAPDVKSRSYALCEKVLHKSRILIKI